MFHSGFKMSVSVEGKVYRGRIARPEGASWTLVVGQPLSFPAKVAH